MVDFLAATATYGQGFKPTSVSDEYTIKIYVNVFAKQKHADERVQNEIATFMRDNRYVSYRVTGCRFNMFPTIFYEYIVQFARDPSASK